MILTPFISGLAHLIYLFNSKLFQLALTQRRKTLTNSDQHKILDIDETQNIIFDQRNENVYCYLLRIIMNAVHSKTICLYFWSGLKIIYLLHVCLLIKKLLYEKGLPL